MLDLLLLFLQGAWAVIELFGANMGERLKPGPVPAKI